MLTKATEPVAAAATPRRRKRVLAQAAAIGAGFVIGAVAYLALRGDHPRPVPDGAPPVAAARPAPAPPRPSPFEGDTASQADRIVEPVNKAGVERQIRGVLSRWSDSLLHDDLDTHASLYAPTVGPYFTRNRVARPEIRTDIENMRKQYGRVTSYKLSDIAISPVDANHAVARFRKAWETEGNRFSGEEREQLSFTRQGEDWLIASERELKVYWVRKK